MRTVVRVGLDIAKDVFQVHAVDESDGVSIRRKLRRSELLDFFKTLEPCLIGIEACATSHHWARALAALGHQVKLIPGSFVKPFVKSQKNDAADAEAICEAVGRPNMRFVAIKTEEQQAVLTIHRTRDLLTRQRTMLINAFRAHIAEYGQVARLGRLGVDALLELVETDQTPFIPRSARGALKVLAAQIRLLESKAKALEAKIISWHRSNPQSQRLATIPGVGVLTASALAATIPDPSLFKSGRALSAWLGLVPRQYSSGGKTRLGSITKRGDRYIRKLLVFGARAVLSNYKSRRTKIPRSMAQIVARKHFRVALVALANKTARIAWALLTKKEVYRPPATLVACQAA
jgi:transposase